jgi:hypothetical protein
MKERRITPHGRDAISAGPVVDDWGEPYVVVMFDDPDRDERLVVTFTRDLFRDVVKYLGAVDAACDRPAIWKDARDAKERDVRSR